MILSLKTTFFKKLLMIYDKLCNTSLPPFIPLRSHSEEEVHNKYTHLSRSTTPSIQAPNKTTQEMSDREVEKEMRALCVCFGAV